MQKIYDALNFIDGNILWGVPMIVFLIFTGVLLSVFTRFFQVRKFGFALKRTFIASIKQMRRRTSAERNDEEGKEGKEKKEGGAEGKETETRGDFCAADDTGKGAGARKNKKTISPFAAFSTAVSGTVGTGNIVGVTTAILSGGPGAVFWMWVSAFFGCVTKYAEITLGLYYRKRNKDGEFVGGPMQYIEHGVKSRWLAAAFAVFAILAAAGMGSVQADTIEKTWQGAFGIPVWVTALIIALLTALVIIGGIKRIGAVASCIVPFMAVLFIVLALILVCANIAAVPAALGSIFTSAFTARSLLSGFAGYGIAKAMRYGFARGVFSNEAGLGSSSIAHSSADTREPVEQGLWGVFEVFLDTFVICTLTALFVLTSGVNTGSEDGAAVAMSAFTGVLGEFGTVAYSIILPLFAFTTVLAWAVYGAKSVQYLCPRRPRTATMAFNIVYIALILGMGLLTFFYEGALGADFVWLISDMTNALMAIPNLIALIVLSKQVVAITENYFARKRGEITEPMLSAYAPLAEDEAEGK